MTGNADGANPKQMTPEAFLALLDRAATYALTRGVPSFLSEHLLFLVDYVNAWLDTAPGREAEVAKALLSGSRRWSPIFGSHLMVRVLQADRIPRRGRAVLLLVPMITGLLAIAVKQFGLSVGRSAVHAFRTGVRSVPPLITAVVVVFVTGDAWRILGTGFTPRFFALVGALVLASMLFLVRRDYWTDIEVSSQDAPGLLAGINPRHLPNLHELSGPEIEPTPIRRPTGLGAALIYLSYLTLSLFALMVVAIMVTLALVVVGGILFDAGQTAMMAHSVRVYVTLPGHIVITRQLLSLSLSLGAFAAFFEVAAMHKAERQEFMDTVLLRLRRALLVYTIYCQARGHAREWTGIAGDFEPDGRPRGGKHQPPVPDGQVSPVT